MRYAVNGADGNDYEVVADHYDVLGGALLFEDQGDRLLIAYSPSFWRFVSRIEEDE